MFKSVCCFVTCAYYYDPETEEQFKERKLSNNPHTKDYVFMRFLLLFPDMQMLLCKIPIKRNDLYVTAQTVVDMVRNFY